MNTLEVIGLLGTGFVAGLWTMWYVLRPFLKKGKEEN